MEGWLTLGGGLLGQLFSYSVPTWLLLAAIAFLAARFGGWLGLLLGQFVVAFVVFFPDLAYFATNAGMDMDFTFTICALVRILAINAVLLLVGAGGLALRRRSRQRQARPAPAGPLPGG